MITHELISEKIRLIAPQFPLKKVSYFGSYAASKQTSDSDLDLLVEFVTPGVSLFMLSELKYRLEDELNISIDIIHSPLPKDSMLIIENEVPVYGQ